MKLSHYERVHGKRRANKTTRVRRMKARIAARESKQEV